MPQIAALLLAEIGITAVTVGATAFAIASAVVEIGLSVGLSFAASLLAGKPSIPKPADGKIPKRQSFAPRVRGFGRSPSQMMYACYETTVFNIGSGATVPTGGSADVLAFHDGLIDGIEEYHLNDDLVTLDGSGFVQAGDDGRYGGNVVQIKTRMGLPTETAYTEVIDGLGTSIWTTHHRGDGVASLALLCSSVTAQDFQKIYPNGLPQPWLVCRWRACFDPRASGQDPYDESTWTWTDNPVLHLLTYTITDEGEDYDIRILPEVAYWIAAADVCDEEVDLLASGTEKRYTAGGVYQADNNPSDIKTNILDCFDGWLGETGTGALRIYAGRFYTPTVTLEPKHITGFSVERFQTDEEVVNEVDFTFTDPTQKWSEVEGNPWRDEDDIADRGKVRSTNVSLPWVHTQSQGRRLVKREMHRASSPARGTVQTDLAGFAALGERYVYLSIPQLPSLGTFAAQITNGQIDAANGKLSFDFTLVTAAIDEWTASEEGLAPAAPIDVPHDPLPVPTGVDADAEQIEISPGVDGARIAVTFDTPNRTDLNFSVLYRTHDSGAGAGPWFEAIFTGVDFSDPTITVRTSVVAVDTVYDVKVASIGPSGTYSDYSGEVIAEIVVSESYVTSTGEAYVTSASEVYTLGG